MDLGERPFTFADWEAGKPFPKSWDCADAIDDGWTKPQLLEFMRRTVKPWDGPPAAEEPAEIERRPEPPQAKETAKREPYSDSDFSAQQVKTVEQTKPDNVVQLKPKAKKVSVPHPVTDPLDWRSRLIMKEEGGLQPGVMTNWREFLENHEAIAGCFRLDTFTGIAMIVKPLPWDRAHNTVPRPTQDGDALGAALWLETKGMRPKGTAALDGIILDIARANSFNPVQEYFNGLVWDGEPRMDALFHKGFIATAKEAETAEKYIEAVGRAFLISVVARAMQPGCKADAMLILEGAQNQGKSTAVKRLLPNGDWFSDAMPHDVSSKDAQQHVAGKLIIEMPEINQLRKSEADDMKAFLSRQVDQFRPPYGRHDVKRPRQCIFVGTTNQSEYLSDQTGNRRFWPVRLECVDMQWIEDNREQLWAEAMAAYLTGEKWWLTDDAYLAAMETQRERVSDDVWMDDIAEYTRGRRRVSFKDIYSGALSFQTKEKDMRSRARIKSCMTSLGFEYRKAKVAGVAMWTWCKDDELEMDL